ncbi:MAG: aldolase/citrate lyase family protein [Alphaproteobacteria bacterium]|nr:aldolase/citrate lyase family protein [Alphaproteobacteria bacterium]
MRSRRGRRPRLRYHGLRVLHSWHGPDYGRAGAEFAIFDMEHSGIGLETIKQKMAYARFTSCLPMVWVPTIAYSTITQALDAGALGIMAPVVETSAQAELLVAATRYPPAGIRDAAVGVAHNNYDIGSISDKIAAANARTLVIATIETAVGSRMSMRSPPCLAWMCFGSAISTPQRVAA